MQHQVTRFLLRHEHSVRCVDHANLRIAHFFELLAEHLHIAIAVFAHEIMNGEGATFFQNTQGFQQKLLFICACDIVVNIVACDCIKSFIGKGKPCGIAFFEKKCY